MEEVIILILATTVLALGINHINLKDDLAQSKKTLSHTTRHLDSKSGGTSLLTGDMINYNLRTWDGGNHWYAVEIDDDWGVSILGESEEVYPGLLKHLEAWDRLSDPEHKPTRSEQIVLLRDMGFTVEEKE